MSYDLNQSVYLNENHDNVGFLNKSKRVTNNNNYKMALWLFAKMYNIFSLINCRNEQNRY